MRIHSAGRIRATIVLSVLILNGCGMSGKLPQGLYRNGILTMNPVDQNKLMITVRAEYNVDTEKILAAVEKQFPDVELVPVFHCAPDTDYELRKSLLSGTSEDIMISPNLKAIADIAPETLMDLSADNYANSYEDSAVRDCEINGKLYYLPGPSSVYGIVYDRTMFRENGWEVPGSYSGFISLVKKINASGIRAIQPTCKYARQAQLVFTMFSYDMTFDGIENARWLSDYRGGHAKMNGHIDGALQRYRELFEAGVIRPDDFDIQPGNRSDMFYRERQCAMIIENEQAVRYAKAAGSDHEYAMMPFWCGDEKNSDHLMSIPGYYIGLSAALSAKENARKLSKIKEILRWISTPEGQNMLSGGETLQISNVTGTTHKAGSFSAGVEGTLKKGNFAPEVALLPSGNNNPVEKILQTDLRKYLEGTMSSEELEKDCDAVRDKNLDRTADPGEKLGTAERDFTTEETGLFIADALKKKTGADIGLCLMGTVHRGTVSRLYKGDVCAADIRTLDLNVGTTGKDKNDKKLWVVSASGSEVKELLEKGCAYDPADGVPNMPYYVASGLRIRFAPWQREKLLSVRTEDGKALAPDKTYRVALWGWPFDDACTLKVEEVFSDICEDILSQAVRDRKNVKPENNGRFEIVYSK